MCYKSDVLQTMVMMMVALYVLFLCVTVYLRGVCSLDHLKDDEYALRNVGKQVETAIITCHCKINSKLVMSDMHSKQNESK